MALGDTYPPHVALPLAEVSLAQIGVHDRGDPEPGREWRGGLERPPQVAYVDRRHGFVRESIGEPLCLVVADARELRVAMPVDESEVSS